VIGPSATADRDPDVFKYVLTQSYIALNCLVLLAVRVLLMHAVPGRCAATLILLTIGFATMRSRISLGDGQDFGSYLLAVMSNAIYCPARC
jgi:hypothetical protein